MSENGWRALSGCPMSNALRADPEPYGLLDDREAPQ